MTPKNGNGPFVVPPGTALLGEILTWSCSGVKIRHADLIGGLKDADLDESVARELAPRHAFTRACKKLSEARIIRQIAEDAHTITFQFTKESKASDSWEYSFETRLVLAKSTGTITCDLPGLATLAQEELDRCIEARNGADVTRTIQRLFERNADLFPIRDKGGVYFVPERHTPFIDQIDRFLKKLNGNLRRFPVPAGTPHGDRSVKEAVTSGLTAMIEEHRAAIALFGEDTRESTLERAAERIRVTSHKLSAYAEYLADERAKLEAQLTLAAGELRARIAALSEAGEAVAS
ncbi:MAG: DUF6744 family protein [Gemmataceae bacterium]